MEGAERGGERREVEGVCCDRQRGPVHLVCMVEVH